MAIAANVNPPATKNRICFVTKNPMTVARITKREMAFNLSSEDMDAVGHTSFICAAFIKTVGSFIQRTI
jgi:hypothetical protein